MHPPCCQVALTTYWDYQIKRTGPFTKKGKGVIMAPWGSSPKLIKVAYWTKIAATRKC